MVRVSLIAAIGFFCTTMLAIGLGFVVPASGAVGATCDVVAIVSGVFSVGLLDGE
jgi:hypothetical protein